MGFVTRVLDEYYPHTDQPEGLTDLNQRAAAVQAAIWYFSDRYVLDPGDPLRDSVAEIVNAVIAARTGAGADATYAHDYADGGERS